MNYEHAESFQYYNERAEPARVLIKLAQWNWSERGESFHGCVTPAESESE